MLPATRPTTEFVVTARSAGSAVVPVALTLTVLAAMSAALVLSTALAAMVKAVPPAVFVTSPVKAPVRIDPVPLNSIPPLTVIASGSPVPAVSRPIRLSVAISASLVKPTALAAIVVAPSATEVTSPEWFGWT